MSQWGQALVTLGFLIAVFLAGYGARAGLSRLRRRRRLLGQSRGRLFYAGRRIAVAEADERDAPAAPMAFDRERLAGDLDRLGRHVEELRALYAGQQELCAAARGDLATAAERFQASVEQTRALTASLNERLDAAQRLQVDLEQVMARLRKRAKVGDEAVLPFKVRQRRLSERK
ncbi:MAG TPA: hypothetical protein VMV26_16345 [Alphaproteobacteria bacterium]|jgi:hypothetical protein|nr:hypothetical protein [Alphaproteobacteria bacterium]